MTITALTNVRIFDGRQVVSESGTILIERDHILEVIDGQSNQVVDEAVDLAGHTVTPGLIDVHTHIVGGDVLPVSDYSSSRRMSESLGMQAFRSADAARTTLLAGYTSIRDVGCRDYLDVDLRDAIQAGLVYGPRIVACGLGLTPTGGHVHQRAMEADGKDGVIQAVRQHVRHRVDAIKIIGITGGMSTPGQNPGSAQYRFEEVEAAVQEAHRWNKKVASHAHGEEGIENALRSGVDTLGHGLFLNPELADLMAEKGTVFVPTLSNDFHTRRLESEGRLPEAVFHRRLELKEMGVVVPSIEERMSHARAAGVTVATGSDAGGNAQVLHGTNAAEIVMLVECGYSTEEALAAATSTAARAIGLDHITGTIERGKIADLAVFTQNPLERIEAVSPLHSGGPAWVISRGNIVLRNGKPQI